MTIKGALGIGNLAARVSKIEKFTEVFLLPIEDVESKEQVRTIFTGIEELAQTIKSDQHQSPIIVTPKNEDGKYVILKGERRWRACKLLGMTRIKAIIDASIYNSVDHLVGELIENIQRDDLKPIELSRALKKLEQEGLNRGQIQERIGKSQSFISVHISMLDDLPACVEKILEEHPRTAAQTVTYLKKAYSIDQAKTEELCTELLEEGISRSVAKQFVESFTKANVPVSPAVAPVTESTVGTNNLDSSTGSVLGVSPASDDAAELKDTVTPVQTNRTEELQQPLEGECDIAVTNTQPTTEKLVASAEAASESSKISVSLVSVAVSRVVDGKKRLGILSLDLITGDSKNLWVNENGVESLWPADEVKIEGVYED